MLEQVFDPVDRPSCEVLVDRVWRYAEVHMWERRPDGWWAYVAWQPVRGESYRRDAFHQSEVREVEDWARYLETHARNAD